MHKFAVIQGGNLDVTAVFANKGVLLAGEPIQEEFEKLHGHNGVYKAAFTGFCNDQGIKHTYTNYTELGIPGPDFVNPKESIAGPHKGVYSPEEIIKHLNDFLVSVGLPPYVEGNGRNKKVIKKMHHLGGQTSSDEVYWLTAGYLSFDHMIPKLVGDTGLYIATERFEPLFGISNMTPELKGMARLQLKA
jgi:hypothetical protein